MRTGIFGVLSLAGLSFFSTSAEAGAVASAFKRETRRGANFFNAQSAIDGNPETCWMVPGESENIGETILIDVANSTIDALGMIVGWSLNEETFTDYYRIKTVRMEVLSYDDNQELVPVAQRDVEFADVPEYQIIDIEDVVLDQGYSGGKVRLTITEVYEGRDYPNFGISEVAVFLQEFEAPARISAASSETQGNGLSSLRDDDASSVWSANVEGAGFTVSSHDYSVSSIGFSSPRSQDFARPRNVRVSIQGASTDHELEDSSGVQWVRVPAIMGYNGGGFGDITVEIIDTYPGTTHATEVGLSELEIRASAYQGF